MTEPALPAAHYRLSDETWAEILAAYRNGATAGELAVQWRVSRTSIYRKAQLRGVTKKAGSDATARAHAQALIDAASQRLSDDDAKARAEDMERLFARFATVNMAWLARRTIAASGAALTEGRMDDASALAKLALAYQRLSTPDDADQLDQMQAVIFDEEMADRYFRERRGLPDDSLIHGTVELYWKRRLHRKLEEERQRREMERLRARVAELEGALPGGDRDVDSTEAADGAPQAP